MTQAIAAYLPCCILVVSVPPLAPGWYLALWRAPVLPDEGVWVILASAAAGTTASCGPSGGSTGCPVRRPLLHQIAHEGIWDAVGAHTSGGNLRNG